MKVRKSKAQKAYRDDYSHSISKSSLQHGPLKYIELEDYLAEDGQPQRLYFRAVPSALMIPIQEQGRPPLEKWGLMISALSWCVVDPATREPIMTKEEWEEWADIKLLQTSIGAILGIEFEDTSEDEELDKLELEQAIEMEEMEGPDSNPLDATIGTDSPTPSTLT